MQWYEHRCQKTPIEHRFSFFICHNFHSVVSFQVLDVFDELLLKGLIADTNKNER